MQKLEDKDMTDKNISKKICDAFDALQPMIKFLNRALEA